MKTVCFLLLNLENNQTDMEMDTLGVDTCVALPGKNIHDLFTYFLFLLCI
jgi:hypothetical protein